MTTVSNEAKSALAKAAGADVVVLYTEGDPVKSIRAAAPHGVQRVVEVAPSNLSLDAKVLAPRGKIMLYASTPTDPQLPVRPFMELCATVECMLLYMVTPADLEAAVADVSAALSAGALTPLPFHRFTLDQIAEAQRAVEDGAVGKVILDLDAS